jgi:beta-galactosidase
MKVGVLMSSEIFRYGAQYYRPPNPPESQWLRDCQNYSNFGFNIMKVWAMWTHTNPAPGEYEFADLERICDLALENGFKVIINTILEDAPYWLEAKHPESRYIDQDGTGIQLMARPNKPGGGWPGLCLDNEPVRKQASEFLERVGSHFRGHEAVWGYDCWNEAFNEAPNYKGMDRVVCYCEATTGKFREWLIGIYKDIGDLNKAWSRKYSDWKQVLPPRSRGGYPDWLDWMKFRLDNQVEQMEWRVKSIRKGDPDHPVMSHGLVPPLHNLPI